MDWEERKKVYDAEYYDGELDGHYREWWWRDDYVWGPRARVIYELYRPQSVLVCGCAKGSLVHYLYSMFGIDAYGFDLSEYAINHTPFPGIRDRLRIIDAAIESLPFDDLYFDVVVAFDIIEHMEEAELNSFIDNLTSLARNYILIRAPMCMIDDKESFRINRKMVGLSLVDRWAKIKDEPSFRDAVPNIDDKEHPNTQNREAVKLLFQPDFVEMSIDPYFYDIQMGSSKDNTVPVIPFYETLSLRRQ